MDGAASREATWTDDVPDLHWWVKGWWTVDWAPCGGKILAKMLPNSLLLHFIYTESKQHCVPFDTRDWGGSDPAYFRSAFTFTFIRRFYTKRLTIAFRLYIFFSMCVPWESNPQPFALLTQCSTTEPHRNTFMRHCVFTLNSEQTQTRFRAALNRLCKDALSYKYCIYIYTDVKIYVITLCYFNKYFAFIRLRNPHYSINQSK